MAHIGNRKDAAFIQEWYHDGSGRRKNGAPEGWERVGNGSYRVAFRHIADNVIYKVEYWPSDEDGYGSAAEVRNAQVLMRKSGGTGILGTRLRIPKVSGFKFGAYVVVAMEMVTKAHANDYNAPTQACPEGRWDLYQHGKFQDMHWENYFIDDKGYCVPVDMASPRAKGPGGGDIRVLMGHPREAAEKKRRGYRW